MTRWGRLALLQVVTLAVFALFMLQLARIQLGDEASGPAGSATAVRSISVEAPRGLIFDRNGVPLARNVPRFSIVAVPARLPAEPDDRRAALLALERETGIALRTIEDAVTAGLASSDPFRAVTLRTGLSAEQAIAMRAALASLPGVTVEAQAVREYSSGDLLPRILGYMGAIGVEEVDFYLDAGYPLDARVGRTGIEQQLEAQLRGQPGRRLVVTDATGQELRSLGEVAAQPGADLTLSIDLALQSVAMEALARGIATGLTRVEDDPDPTAAGAVVVIDVRSGELLVLVSLPSYDISVFTDPSRGDELQEVLSDPSRPLVQRSYMEVRPPGSTFKTVTGMAALQEGVATPETRITSRGSISVQDEFNPDKQYIFRDWAVLGTLDFYGGIAMSSDIYYYYLSGGYVSNGKRVFEGLGPDRLARYARAAGFGETTGLDLPGEAAGTVPDPAWKSEVIEEPWVLGDTYTFGIGQGYLTVTPLQMAVSTAAIANGGDILVPQIVRAVSEGETTVRTTPEIIARLPVDDEYIAVMREAMRQAAAAGGTAASGQPAGTTIGGKTGTAEFGIRNAKGEFPTHAWFIGFAPYDEPEIAVVVFIHHGVGSANAAPVAREIFEAYASGTATVAQR